MGPDRRRDSAGSTAAQAHSASARAPAPPAARPSAPAGGPLDLHAAPPRIAVLTRDEALLATFRDSAPHVDVASVAAPPALADLLLSRSCRALVLDVALVEGALAAVIGKLAEQFPELPLVAVGTRADEAAAAPLLSAGVLYRFLHRPVSPERARAFLGAAIRRSEELERGTAASWPGLRPGGSGDAPPLGGDARSGAAHAGPPTDADLDAARMRASPSVAPRAAPRSAPAAHGASATGRSAASRSRGRTPLALAAVPVAIAAVGFALATRDAPDVPVAAATSEPATPDQTTPDPPALFDSAREAAPGAPDRVDVRALAERIKLARTAALATVPVRSASDALQASLPERAAAERIESAPTGGVGDPGASERADDVGAEVAPAPAAVAGGGSAAEAGVPSTLPAAMAGDVSSAPVTTGAPAAVPASTDAPRSAAADTAAAFAPASAPASATAALAAALPLASAPTPALVPAPAPAPAPLRKLIDAAPDYPARARAKNVEGWVDVAFTVGRSGIPENVRVMAGQPQGVFDAAAVDAVRRWRYAAPPAPQDANVRVRFRVDR